MIAANAAAQIAGLGTVIVIQTAYAILVARILGPEDFGQFTFAFSITQMVLIGCDLGLHNTAIRKISSSHGRGPDDVSAYGRGADIFSTFFYLKLVLSFLLLFFVLLLSLALRQTQETRLALALFGLGMFFHSLNLALNVTFQAHGRLYLGSLNTVLISMLNVLIGLGFLKLGGRVASLGLAYALATFLAFLINRATFQKEIHPVHVVKAKNWKPFIRESLPVGLGTLFHTISSRIDVTLLMLLAGSFQTGVYGAAYRIFSALMNIPLGIFSAVLPVMASFGEDFRKIRELFLKSAAIMVAISTPLALVLFFYSGTLIHFVYGDKYRLSTTSLEILAWSLIPVFVGMAFSHVILSQAALVRFLPFTTGAAMIANVAANLVLIPKMGNKGAALSTLITEVLLAGCYALVASRALLKGTQRND